MKKAISKSKVQRMRNIVSGNYNDKSVIRSGYTKKIAERKEGDIWEEKGKQWTIKNGIKRTINKLDFARKVNRIPFGCPKCSKPLRHPAHKQMYKRWGMCLECVQAWYNEMTKNATYETEAGDVEDWSGGKTNEELSKEFKESVKKAKEKRNGKAN